MWVCIFGIEKMKGFISNAFFFFIWRAEMCEGGHWLFDKNGRVSDYARRGEGD